MPVTARIVHEVNLKADSLSPEGRVGLVAPYLPEPNTSATTTSAVSKPPPPRQRPVAAAAAAATAAAVSSKPPRRQPKGQEAGVDTRAGVGAGTGTRGAFAALRHKHKQRIRPLVRSWIHYLIYFLIQTVFGIYIRFAHAYSAVLQRALAIRFHHYHSPEYIQRDVAALSRVPEHLSVILKRRPQRNDDGAALEALMDEVAELTAWSAAAGVPLLSVYEKSGVLKNYMRELQDVVELKLGSYFGWAGTPTLRIYAPNYSSTSTATSSNTATPGSGRQQRVHIDLLLLSASDGRDTLVDLTRTLAEMAQAKKLQPKDITPELIDTEIMATTAIPDQDLLDDPDSHRKPAGKEVSAGEPDLVIIFGSHVKLDGYPPWQIRLSEMFCVGDVGGDINAPTRVEYQSFLRALWKYAGAEMRFGK